MVVVAGQCRAHAQPGVAGVAGGAGVAVVAGPGAGAVLTGAAVPGVGGAGIVVVAVGGVLVEGPAAAEPDQGVRRIGRNRAGGLTAQRAGTVGGPATQNHLLTAGGGVDQFTQVAGKIVSAQAVAARFRFAGGAYFVVAVAETVKIIAAVAQAAVVGVAVRVRGVGGAVAHVPPGGGGTQGFARVGAGPGCLGHGDEPRRYDAGNGAGVHRGGLAGGGDVVGEPGGIRVAVLAHIAAVAGGVERRHRFETVDAGAGGTHPHHVVTARAGIDQAVAHAVAANRVAGAGGIADAHRAVGYGVGEAHVIVFAAMNFSALGLAAGTWRALAGSVPAGVGVRAPGAVVAIAGGGFVQAAQRRAAGIVGAGVAVVAVPAFAHAAADVVFAPAAAVADGAAVVIVAGALPRRGHASPQRIAVIHGAVVVVVAHQVVAAGAFAAVVALRARGAGVAGAARGSRGHGIVHAGFTVAQVFGAVVAVVAGVDLDILKIFLGHLRRVAGIAVGGFFVDLAFRLFFVAVGERATVIQRPAYQPAFLAAALVADLQFPVSPAEFIPDLDEIGFRQAGAQIRGVGNFDGERRAVGAFKLYAQIAHPGMENIHAQAQAEHVEQLRLGVHVGDPRGIVVRNGDAGGLRLFFRRVAFFVVRRLFGIGLFVAGQIAVGKFFFFDVRRVRVAVGLVGFFRLVAIRRFIGLGIVAFVAVGGGLHRHIDLDHFAPGDLDGSAEEGGGGFSLLQHIVAVEVAGFHPVHDADRHNERKFLRGSVAAVFGGAAQRCPAPESLDPQGRTLPQAGNRYLDGSGIAGDGFVAVSAAGGYKQCDCRRQHHPSTHGYYRFHSLPRYGLPGAAAPAAASPVRMHVQQFASIHYKRAILKRKYQKVPAKTAPGGIRRLPPPFQAPKMTYTVKICRIRTAVGGRSFFGVW